MRAIFKRELRSYSSSPISYMCVAVLLALFGFYYAMVMNSRSSSYITSVYGATFIWCMMIVPILTMRSMSEDHRNRTDQALLTTPVGVTGTVMGKFLACVSVFGIVLLGSLLPILVISFMSSLNWVTVLGTVFDTLLYGGAMVSIGVFTSSLTQSQVISAIDTFAASMFLLIVDRLSGSVSNTIIAKLIGWISSNSRYTPFTTGAFNVSSIVFFLSVATVFLFFTTRCLESRRWN